MHSWACIRHAAQLNDSPAVQQEMLIYDDQRMGCVQGFARIMQALKLLRAVAPGAHRSQTIALGRGKPRLQYELTYDPQHLENLVSQFGDTVIGVEGELTTEVFWYVGS